MSLWFDTISPITQTGPTLIQSGVHTNASFANPEAFNITSPVQAGDCCVLCIACSGNTAVSTVPTGLNGCNFTFGLIYSTTNNPTHGLWVGYNCGAGGQNISMAGISGHSGDIIWGIFRNVRSASNPIRAYNSSAFASANSAGTTVNPVNAGDLFVATFGGNNPGKTWTLPAAVGGVPWTQVVQSNVNNSVSLFYLIKATTGAANGTSSYSDASFDNMGCSAAACIPAP